MKSKLTIYAAGLLAAAAVALTGNYFAAFLLLFIVDSLLAYDPAKAGTTYGNALGSLTPSLIVAKALSLVTTVRPALQNMSLGFADLDSGAVEANYNATVYTRTLGLPVVQNFRAAATDRADVDVPCTLNNFKQIYYTFTPEEYSGTSRNLLQESAMPLAIAFSNYIVDTVAALWTAANFAQSLAVPGGWSYVNTLLELRKKLKKLGVPQNAPWFSVNNEDVHTSFLADPLIVAWLNNQSNANAISTGVLGSGVAGLQLDEYPALPPAGNLLGFAGAKDSTVYAHRVPKNPETIPGFDAKFPGNLEIITDPTTKLSVMLSQYIGTDLSANLRICWMNGFAKGNTNNGVRLISA